MNKENFIAELKKINVQISDLQLNQLDEYYKMIIEYNKHTNLTRIVNEEEVYLKHFYDSLTLAKMIKFNDQSVLDVGTGAGFPGIVLKIVFPKLNVTLVDSLNKRIIFLNEVINKLSLDKIEAIHARAEEYINESREKFDIVTSRAVANLNVLSELCIPFVKEGGIFIPMKADAEEEINNSQKAIKQLGGKIKDILSFKLPMDGGIRTLIKIEKSVKTDEKYPRKFNEIKKKPL